MHATASEPARWRSALAPLGAALAALALLWGLSLSRHWQALEFKSFDALTALAAPGQPMGPIPIVILAIDEPTFQQLQRPWPFPRSLHAELLRRVRADGALAVGFDVVFADPSQDAEDAALAQAIHDAGSVVLAAARERIDSAQHTLWTEVPPLERLTQAGAVVGLANVQPDEDLVVRRAPTPEGSLAQRLAAMAQHNAGLVPSAARPAPEWVAYRGPRGSFDTRSYYQALEPGLLPEGFFVGKIVLVGRSLRTAADLRHAQDMFNAPMAHATETGTDRLMPGVELQATLIDNLLASSEPPLRSAPAAWGWLALLAPLPLLAWAGARWHPGASAGATALWLLALGLGTAWLFVRARLWLPPLLPMAAAVATWGSTALTAYARARRQARQTRAMFAQYVSPLVVQQLVAQPHLLRLGGEVRELTLMFTDLANFTTLAERLSAEQTVEVLTGYFNAMTPLIQASGGTVDKYIGDAVMAFWGAPLADAQHAEHAVRTAIAMQQAMEPLVHALQARGLPPIAMRIGLHTGPVVVGNVGSAQRFSYTAIGDAVNLAARLEGANKAFGTGILLSDATAALLPPDIALRPLDDVIVKGKTAPVRVFTPCADRQACRLAQAALQAFHARHWDEAQAHLQALLQRLPGDKAALQLLERLQQARALAPDAPWSAAVALDKL